MIGIHLELARSVSRYLWRLFAIVNPSFLSSPRSRNTVVWATPIICDIWRIVFPILFRSSIFCLRSFKIVGLFLWFWFSWSWVCSWWSDNVDIDESTAIAGSLIPPLLSLLLRLLLLRHALVVKFNLGSVGWTLFTNVYGMISITTHVDVGIYQKI